MNDRNASFDRQYAAIRASGGIMELDGWSSIALTGADRQKFLNNFCTNDVKRLVAGDACEAFITNVKGRIVGHGLIMCGEDELVFVGVGDQSPRLIEHLDRYIIREDVQLRDTTPERAYVLVAGDESVRTKAKLGDVAARRFAWNLVGSPFECLVGISADDKPALINRCVEMGLVHCQPEAFATARIEGGTPLFGIDFDEHNFPQEVGRDRQAISFTKGCYLGQETVARIDALGHVNQQLVGVRFFGADLPEIGTELKHTGQTVGRVTSSTYSPRLKSPLALAKVRREANANGTRLESPAGECEVIGLPVSSL